MDNIIITAYSDLFYLLNWAGTNISKKKVANMRDKLNQVYGDYYSVGMRIREGNKHIISIYWHTKASFCPRIGSKIVISGLDDLIKEFFEENISIINSELKNESSDIIPEGMLYDVSTDYPFVVSDIEYMSLYKDQDVDGLVPKVRCKHSFMMIER